MFREMRRINQQLSDSEAKDILARGSSGVLALMGDDGYPYTVPLNYIYEGNKIYFHGAKTGHKIDALKKNSKASFCVIEKSEVLPEKFTTAYRSAVVFGTVKIVSSKAKKLEAIKKLTLKFSKGEKERIDVTIDKEFDLLCVLELSIEHLSGKESLALINTK